MFLNMVSVETKSSQFLRKQHLVIVFVTQVCSKEQREDLEGNVYSSHKHKISYVHMQIE